MRPLKNFKNTQMKRYFIQLGAMAVLLSACNGNDQEFDASGVFEATEVIVSSEANGKIVAFELEEGMSLAAGQTVGMIDCENLSLQKAQVAASVEALAAQFSKEAAGRSERTVGRFIKGARQIAEVSECGGRSTETVR